MISGRDRAEYTYSVLTRTRSFFISFLSEKLPAFSPLSVYLKALSFFFFINSYVLSALVYISNMISPLFLSYFTSSVSFSDFWSTLFFHSSIIVFVLWLVLK